MNNKSRKFVFEGSGNGKKTQSGKRSITVPQGGSDQSQAVCKGHERNRERAVPTSRTSALSSGLEIRGKEQGTPECSNIGGKDGVTKRLLQEKTQRLEERGPRKSRGLHYSGLKKNPSVIKCCLACPAALRHQDAHADLGAQKKEDAWWPRFVTDSSTT